MQLLSGARFHLFSLYSPDAEPRRYQRGFDRLRQQSSRRKSGN